VKRPKNTSAKPENESNKTITSSKTEIAISKAEIAYKSGRIKSSITFANQALRQNDLDPSKTIALRIFLARAYSKLGSYTKSNTIYRELLKEKVYMPPIIMGLLYNNFKTASAEKMQLNVGLVKTCLHLR